ncbi:MAG: 30S ribosomal protein S17 [Parcubacteria group bacterium]|nr:30S ribosomal protein S17 [Parcubacteria group bacterium]
MSKRILRGEVVSTKTKDTVVVAVTRLKTHPKYRKIIKVTKRYQAHYTGGDVVAGDKVVIEESRPISKMKQWAVKRILK